MDGSETIWISSGRIQIHITLGKCNRNVGLSESLVDRPIHIVQHRYPVVDTSNIAALKN